MNKADSAMAFRVSNHVVSYDATGEGLEPMSTKSDCGQTYTGLVTGASDILLVVLDECWGVTALDTGSSVGEP